MVFCKIGVLRNFAKITGKHLCWCPFCNKEETMAKVFPDEVFQISMNNFFTEHLRTTASKSCAVKINRRKKGSVVRKTDESDYKSLQVTTSYYKWLRVTTAQKMKFSFQDFFKKCDQIRLRIWSHLLKKSWMENFIFCAVQTTSEHKSLWVTTSRIARVSINK